VTRCPKKIQFIIDLWLGKHTGGNLKMRAITRRHVAKGNKLADNFPIFFMLRPSLQPWRIP
jgi:hypothetical protein